MEMQKMETKVEINYVMVYLNFEATFQMTLWKKYIKNDMQEICRVNLWGDSEATA